MFLIMFSVRPLSLDLSGVVHHVVQGTTVTLECAVLGARPAANLTWFNGSEPILENALRTDVGLQVMLIVTHCSTYIYIYYNIPISFTNISLSEYTA